MHDRIGRRPDLDRGKDVAILLVVFGHLVAREDPTGLGWYEPLRGLVYAFHIPFLFYLSGYAAEISGTTTATRGRYLRLLRRRAFRLLLPAAVFGIIILIGKLAAGPFIHVDHPPGSLIGGLSDMVWRTDRSPAQSVWYLIVLFVYAAVTPPLLALLRERIFVLLALGSIVFWMPASPILYADRIVTNAVFFIAGVAAARQGMSWTGWIDRRRGVLTSLFVAALLVAFLLGTDMTLKTRMMMVSLAAIPALHAAMRRLPPVAASLLDRMTPYAFAIYLLNTVFIGLAKGLTMTVLPWNAACFPIFALILMVAAVGGPMLAAGIATRHRHTRK